MSASTQPLTRGQQLFLQRLLASHVLNDDEAQQLFQQLNDTRCKTMEQCFGLMNQQLTAGFGLEVATVNVVGGRHHAIINQHADAIARGSFTQQFNPHERAYIRSVLEKLVQTEKSPRMDLINLRTELSDPYKLLALPATERCLDLLLDEKWLISTSSSPQRRQSMNCQYQLGPRAFLELSQMLVDFGMPKEDLPQVLFHRV